MLDWTSAGPGWLAAGILAWTAGTWAVESRHQTASAAACLLLEAGMLLLLSFSALRRATSI